MAEFEINREVREEAILNDGKVVEKYGLTYQEIAQPIEKLISGINLEMVRSLIRNHKTIKLSLGYEYLPPHSLCLCLAECSWGDRADYQNSGLQTAGSIIRSGFSKEQEKLAIWAQEFRLAEADVEWLREPNWDFYQEALYNQQNYRKGIGVDYISLTGLLPHLIETHHFFGEKDSVTRTDPEFLIKAFNLERR